MEFHACGMIQERVSQRTKVDQRLSGSISVLSWISPGVGLILSATKALALSQRPQEARRLHPKRKIKRRRIRSAVCPSIPLAGSLKPQGMVRLANLSVCLLSHSPFEPFAAAPTHDLKQHYFELTFFSLLDQCPVGFLCCLVLR